MIHNACSSPFVFIKSRFRASTATLSWRMLPLYELADRSKVESVKLAVKVKLSFPVYSTKAWGRSRGIAPLILNLGTKWSGQHHAPAAFPPGKNPGTHWRGSWVGTRKILKFWSREKTPAPAGIRTQDRPACNPVTTIELSVPMLIQIINKTSIKGLKYSGRSILRTQIPPE